MDAWERLGGAIGRHMVYIMPCCLALGIAFPQVFSVLTPLVSPMFMVMAFQGALGNRFSNVRRTFRQPLPLILILGTAHVFMPILVFLVAGIFVGGDSEVMAGVLLEYCVPIASSSIMWVGMYEGDIALALSAILISAVICPFTLPVTMRLLLGTSVSVDVGSMMTQLLVVVALPTVVGTLVNERTDGWGKKVLGRRLAPLAKVLLLVIITTNSTSIAPFVRNLNPELVGIIVLMGIFCVGGFFLGFALPTVTGQPDDRFASMTFTTAMKNISAGAVIATAYLPARSLFPVMAGTFFQQFMAALFGRLMARRFASS